MLKHLTIVTLTATLLLASCGGEKSDSETIEDLKNSEHWTEDYRPYLKESMSEISGLNLHEFTEAFYHDVEFSPVWVYKDSLTEAGKQLFTEVQGAHRHGLLPQWYQAQLIDSLLRSPQELYKSAKIDILLTDAYLTMASHIRYGAFNLNSGQYRVPKDSLTSDFVSVLMSGKYSPLAALRSIEPNLVEYRLLALACADFVERHPLTDTKFKIENYKSDSVGTATLTKEALIAHGFADSAIFNVDSLYINALKKFQMFHSMGDDGKIGHYTARALNMSNLERWKQIAMNLERWRWRTPFPNTRIYVNIPEFALYYYRNDSLIRRHRVVTGAVTTRTPEFEAKLTYLNVYPYWHVPHSITTNEIMPVVRRDPGYLARNGYSLFDDAGNVVDPNEVDLNRGYYRIRQNYGYGNALGVLAFMFPNPHDVFIHDTPLKFFFTTGVRAYSHGCVRLQDPIDLGKEILKADGNKVVPDSLQSLIDRNIPQNVYLQKKIPIFIEYHTAAATQDGKLMLPLDVYGRDTLTVKMFGK